MIKIIKQWYIQETTLPSEIFWNKTNDWKYEVLQFYIFFLHPNPPNFIIHNSDSLSRCLKWSESEV